MSYFFARLDEKRKLLGNFEKILKISDENSIEKFNVYFNFILENLWVKIEPSERTQFFYNNIFRFGGGGFPPSPGYALGMRCELINHWLSWFCSITYSFDFLHIYAGIFTLNFPKIPRALKIKIKFQFFKIIKHLELEEIFIWEFHFRAA